MLMPQPKTIKFQYLAAYNKYASKKQAYLRKIRALQYHRMTDFNLEVGGYVKLSENNLMLKRLKQIKRLQEITFKIGTANTSTFGFGLKSPQRNKILKRVISHLPHWSSLKLHVTLTTTVTSFLKEKSEQGLIRLLPRGLKYHSINSA